MPDHARIHLLHQHDSGEWALTRGGETIVVRSDRSLSANNMAMILQLARSGAGIAVSDEIIAARECASGRLVPVLEGWSLPSVAISVLTPGRVLPAKTRLFVDMLSDRVADLVGA